jgi:hypothetical protein
MESKPMLVYSHWAGPARCLLSDQRVWNLEFRETPCIGDIVGACDGDLSDARFHEQGCAPSSRVARVVFMSKLENPPGRIRVRVDCCGAETTFGLRAAAPLAGPMVYEPEGAPIAEDNANLLFIQDVPVQALLGIEGAMARWFCPICRPPSEVNQGFTIVETFDVLENRQSLPDGLVVKLSCCGYRMRFLRRGLFDRPSRDAKQRDPAMTKTFAQHYGGEPKSFAKQLEEDRGSAFARSATAQPFDEHLGRGRPVNASVELEGAMHDNQPSEHYWKKINGVLNGKKEEAPMESKWHPDTTLQEVALQHRKLHADCRCRWILEAEAVAQQRLRVEPVAQRTVEGVAAPTNQAFEVADPDGKIQYVVLMPSGSAESARHVRQEFERRLGLGRVVVVAVPQGHELRVTRLVPAE